MRPNGRSQREFMALLLDGEKKSTAQTTADDYVIMGVQSVNTLGIPVQCLLFGLSGTCPNLGFPQIFTASSNEILRFFFQIIFFVREYSV